MNSFGQLLKGVVSIALFLANFISMYNGECFRRLKLSVDDVIVSLKGSNGEQKFKLYGRDYYFTCTLCRELHLCAKKHTLHCMKRHEIKARLHRWRLPNELSDQ